MPERDLQNYRRAFQDLPFEEYVEALRRQALASFLDKVNSVDLQNVLEVGVGRRSIFEEWSTKASRAIVEPDETFLHSVRTRLGETECKYYASFFEQHQTDDRYDLIIASSVLHESEDEGSFLGRAWELLCDSGILVVVVPNAASIHRLIGLELGIIVDLSELSSTNIRMQQRRVYTFKSLEQTLGDYRFETFHTDGIFPKILDHTNFAQALLEGEVDETFLRQMAQIGHRLKPVCSEILMAARKRYS